MKKRRILTAVTLVTAMLLSTLGGVACAQEIQWQAGQNVCGFTVTDVREFAAADAQVVTLEHDKTGAVVMMILNEDTNRAFQIDFATNPEDDTGMPHICEHTTLMGSEKYPVNMFFDVASKLSNTYANAFTSSFMTAYPMASLSEAQLLKDMDYYLDATFHALLTDEIFNQEAWRYTLSSADGDLGVTGTVYNEMRGAITIKYAASFNSIKTALPGSVMGNISGGDPVYIPNLTVEELRAYRSVYYHPSNSMSFLYGKIEDPEAFLSLFDSVFSEFEREDVSEIRAEAGYTPLEESVEAHYEYPVESNADTKNGSVIYYDYVLRGMDDEELSRIELIMTILNNSGSPFGRLMKERLPSANASCELEIHGPEYILEFHATGVNPEDADTFKAVVCDAISEIAQDGFDAELVDAVISATRVSVGKLMEGDDIGVNLSEYIAYYAICTGNMYAYMDSIEDVDLYDEWAQDGSLVECVKKYLTDDPITALSVTEPVAGLSEAREARLAEQLAEIKAGMTDEEIEAIVAQTNAGDKEEEDVSAYIAELNAMTTEELPEDVRVYEITDETGEDGIRRMYAEASAEGLGKCRIGLNANGLSEEELQWAQLYISLLGSLNTSAHTREEMSVLTERYLPGFGMSLSMIDPSVTTGEPANVYLMMGYYGQDEDAEKSTELLYELLFDTDFTATADIKNEVLSAITSIKTGINSSGHYVAIYDVSARFTQAVALVNETEMIPYYEFLCEVRDMLDTDPQAVTDKLCAVRDYLLGAKRGSVIMYSGAAAGHEEFAAAADAFAEKLEDREIERRDYTFDTHTGTVAYALDINTNFNVIGASWEELGVEEYTGDMKALSILMQDRYLLPILREQRGAYAAQLNFNDYGAVMFSYRDPNVADTYDTYAQLGDLLAEDAGLTQEVMDGYILSAYSSIAQNSGELTGGMDALVNLLKGHTQDEKVQMIRELKSFSVEKIPEYVEMLQKLSASEDRATAGYTASIEKDGELFDTVIAPFATK